MGWSALGSHTHPLGGAQRGGRRSWLPACVLLEARQAWLRRLVGCKPGLAAAPCGLLATHFLVFLAYMWPAAVCSQGTHPQNNSHIKRPKLRGGGGSAKLCPPGEP